MASATEAELGAVLINGQDAVPTRAILMEMNHPPPPTLMQVDNSTDVRMTNLSIKKY